MLRGCDYGAAYIARMVVLTVGGVRPVVGVRAQPGKRKEVVATSAGHVVTGRTAY